jgi:hypothetical protein
MDRSVYDIAWASSPLYPGRAHIQWRGSGTGLCGIPVEDPHTARHAGPRTCPECALAFVETVFPASPPPWSTY